MQRMDGDESHTTDASDLVTNAEQSPTHPKSVSPNNRIKMPSMIQNVLLIWLDNKIDETSSDYRNIITDLRHIVNAVNIFVDGDECIHFLESIADEKASMIISGSIARKVIPRVHDWIQVDSIFISCENRKYHKGWINDWPKIKGVFTEIQLMYDDLKQTVQQCEQNSVSISVMNTDGSLENTNLNQYDPHFVYTQIMSEIVFTIRFKQWHINKFIEYCRETMNGNKSALNDIDQLARKYHQHSPIWWYTHECFLHPMLNRAFRTMNCELIIKMGFFIRDLHCQIEQLHQKQVDAHGFSQRFVIYRGQGIENMMFQRIAANKGGLLSFNCFLFTNKSHPVSLKLAKRALTNNNMIGVVFVMIIDTARSNIPFASVIGIQHFESLENKVLLSMHTVFRIGEIQPLADNPRLFQIELILTSDKDNDLRQLTHRIREETFPNPHKPHRLGSLLNEMNQPVRVQQLYQILLELAVKENIRTPIYTQLEMAKQELRKYEEAMTYSEESIDVEETETPFNHQNRAASYNNIGYMYFHMSDYSKALFCYGEALKIQQQSLPSTHPDLATTFSNMGDAYFRTGNYLQALSSQEKALAIQESSSLSVQSDITTSYDNMGNIHFRMGNYPKALSFHEKVLAMRQQALPPDHPFVAASYNNIGVVYYAMKDYSKALPFHEKALSIRQKSLSSTHPDLSLSYTNIGHVYFHMGDYPKALFYHEKALILQRDSLPPMHSDLVTSFNNIAHVYARMNDSANAVSCQKIARTIQHQLLSTNHRNLPSRKTNIVYSGFERASHRAKRPLPSDHGKP